MHIPETLWETSEQPHELEDLNYVQGVIPQDIKDKHPDAILV